MSKNRFISGIRHLIIAVLIGQVACGPHSKRSFDSKISSAEYDDNDDRSSFSENSHNDSNEDSRDRNNHEFPETEIRPGEPREPGSPDGNCHGASCDGTDPNSGGYEPVDSGANKKEPEKPDDFVDSEHENEDSDEKTTPEPIDNSDRPNGSSSAPGNSALDDPQRGPSDLDSEIIEAQKQQKLFNAELKVYKSKYQDLGKNHKKERIDHPLSEKATAIPDDYPFKTPPTSVNGRFLAVAWNYQKEVSAFIKDSDSKVTEKRMILDVSSLSFYEADELYSNNNILGGDVAFKFGMLGLDTIMSLSPVGWTKDLYESVTGKHILTGENLSTFDRSFAVIGIAATVTSLVVAPQTVVMLATVGIVGKIGSKIRSVWRGSNGVRSADELVEGIKIAEKNIDSAKKFGAKTAEETKDFIQTAEGVLGKDIATAGKLENLVDTASALAKDLKFTETTAKRMEDAARYVPREILSEAIKFGKKMPDPQGAAGAERYVLDMFKNGKKYELEVIYRESDNTILHFLYK